MARLHQESPVLHVRFDGRSEEVPLSALDLDLQATDDQIKQAAAGYFRRPSRYFDNYVVARHSNAVVIRPEAVYG